MFIESGARNYPTRPAEGSELITRYLRDCVLIVDSSGLGLIANAGRGGLLLFYSG